jgi:hypothetical protein
MLPIAASFRAAIRRDHEFTNRLAHLAPHGSSLDQKKSRQLSHDGQAVDAARTVTVLSSAPALRTEPATAGLVFKLIEGRH